jgi:hypothetical protein
VESEPIKECDRACLEGRDNLIAVRLKIDRGKTSEIEQLWAGGIAPQAVELLTTPVPVVTEDVPPGQRVSREVMFRVANSYFDALEGDSGKIGAFADDCVRHEQRTDSLQHADVRSTGGHQDLRLHETHPSAPRADSRRAEADRRHLPAVRP